MLSADGNTFWPDDTETIMYLDADTDYSLQDLLEKIKEKWPKADIGNVTIDAKYINTFCVGHPHYDASDYNNFLVITYKP